MSFPGQILEKSHNVLYLFGNNSVSSFLRVCVCVCVLTGAVRASSIFPIMSVGLLFLGGLCVAASEFYRSRHNVILSAGIFFVSAGQSACVCVCVFLSPMCVYCVGHHSCA